MLDRPLLSIFDVPGTGGGRQCGRSGHGPGGRDEIRQRAGRTGQIKHYVAMPGVYGCGEQIFDRGKAKAINLLVVVSSLVFLVAQFSTINSVAVVQVAISPGPYGDSARNGDANRSKLLTAWHDPQSEKCVVCRSTVWLRSGTKK